VLTKQPKRKRRKEWRKKSREEAKIKKAEVWEEKRYEQQAKVDETRPNPNPNAIVHEEFNCLVNISPYIRLSP
jgi:hypothetical protein